MTAVQQGRVLVAVDGSDAGQAALAWAAQRARSAGALLDVVHVWAQQPADVEIGDEPVATDVVRSRAQEFLETCLRDVDPGLVGAPDVRARLIVGRPAEALIAEALGADLVVVGWRGAGGLTRLMMGSVASQVARYSPCTVVVVPESWRPPHVGDAER